jgi:hypothetical protein
MISSRSFFESSLQGLCAQILVLRDRHPQGFEQAELPRAGLHQTLDTSPLGLGLHRPLEGEPLEHALRGPVDVGQVEPQAHEPLDLKRHDTYEHMGPDPAIHKVIHRPDVEGTLEGAKTALYVLKLLVLQDHLLGGKGSVGGLEDELSID